MNQLFQACKALFDKNPRATGVARVLLDDDGHPVDFAYEYLNEAMAAFTASTVDELLGIHAYKEWGDEDPNWLSHFYEAAFEGKCSEFEAASIMLERFLRGEVTPIKEGYCLFTIQDVTSWGDHEPYIEDDMAVGLFFFDTRTSNLMLTSAICERYDFDRNYLSATSFIEALFGPEAAATTELKADRIGTAGKEIIFEGRSVDGRWLRLTARHPEQPERFVLCLIEDLTRAHEAEERSRHHMSVIESLTRENFALFIIDLENNAVEAYRQSSDQVASDFIYSLVDESLEGAREAYLNGLISVGDRAMVDSLLNRRSIEAFLDSSEEEISSIYRRRIEDKEQFVEMRLIRLPGQSRTAVLALRSIHDEMREQLRQKQALQEALELARHASTAKSTFLTNMSHDFRTPMNAIVGFTDLALEEESDPARMRDCLTKIRKSSTHLLRLINDVLDVSRIENGVVEATEEEFDLHELASDMREIFSEDAQKRSLRFTVDTSQLKRSRIAADRQHLGQIMINLIGNAFKFTEPGGMVEVTIAEYDSTQADHGAHVPQGYGRFDFTVRDTGCGMLPSYLDKLFVPFERDGLGKANPKEGTGLGMPITKNLVELLGGTIEVESAVGEGSTFVISLPLKFVEPSSAGEAPAADADAADPSPRTAGAAAERASLAGRRVLVVDDDELSREIMIAILSAEGLEVNVAYDGADAVEQLNGAEAERYDAVLMDMRMPRMNGDEAASVILASEREDLRRLPIIALTADAFEEGRRRSREAGMVAHIAKPFKRAELLDTLAEHMR